MSENAPSIPSVTPPKRSSYIPSLDGIRAGSMLVILVNHLALVFLDVKLPATVAVSMFFLLSGFLVTTALRKSFEKKQTIAVRHFYIHRAIRILPPMAFTVALASLLALAGLVAGGVSLLPALSQALCFGNYWIIYMGQSGIPAGTQVFWYMGVQEQFYLVYPLILLLMMKTLSRRNCALLMWTACVLALLWRFVLVYHFGATYHTYLATDCRFDSLLFGCALAMYGNPALDPIPQTTLNIRRVLLVLATTLWLISIGIRDTGFRETLRYTCQSIFCLAILYLAIVDAKQPLFRWLDHPWMRYAGTVSFSFYLVHYVAIEIVNKMSPAPNPFVKIVLATLLAVPMALALHYGIEKPSARLSKRLGG